MDFFLDFLRVDLLNMAPFKSFMIKQSQNVIEPEKTESVRTKCMNKKQSVLR
jgi:hypothetical protein